MTGRNRKVTQCYVRDNNLSFLASDLINVVIIISQSTNTLYNLQSKGSLLQYQKRLNTTSIGNPRSLSQEAIR